MGGSVISTVFNLPDKPETIRILSRYTENSPESQRMSSRLALPSTGGAFILSLSMFNGSHELTFSDTFILDPMAAVLKLFVYGAAFTVFGRILDMTLPRASS